MIFVYECRSQQTICGFLTPRRQLGERKCSEGYFLKHRGASPGGKLQTKQPFIQLLPFTPADKRRIPDKLSPPPPKNRGKKLFSTNYRFGVGEEETARLQNILHTGIWRSTLSNFCQRQRERWANFRATRANTNNCSG